MQVTKLLSLHFLLELAVCGVSALPITTVSYGSTLGPCLDCQGSRRAGPWRGSGEEEEDVQAQEEGLHQKQADTLDTLLAHINTTLHICEDRNYDRDAAPEPRFMDYDMPHNHSRCPNTSVPLVTYTQDVTSSLAAYVTLLQLMGQTEADYQTEVLDTDPAFSQLATLSQTAACGLGLTVGVGTLCDTRGVPTESTTLDYLQRFWWDRRIVSDMNMYVDSARQCFRHWQTRHL